MTAVNTLVVKAGKALSSTATLQTGDSGHHKTLPGLNALRGLAIVLVLLFHGALGERFRYFSGPFGVMIFFVLSGYLITGILQSEYKKTGNINMRRFYLRRMFRIFPAFYVGLFAATIVSLLMSRSLTLLDVLGAAAYFTDYIRALSKGSDIFRVHMGIAWSLAIEEQFYLLWPMLLLQLFRRCKRPYIAVGIIVGVLWFYRGLFYMLEIVSGNYVSNAFEMRVDALLIGAFFVLYPEKYLAFLFRSRLFVLPSLVGLLFIASYESGWLTSARSVVTAMSLEPVLVGILMVQMIHLGRKHQWKWLDAAPVATLATLSYSLYLFHTPALELASLGNSAGIFRLHSTFRATALILAFSVASYLVIEKPFLRLRDRFVP